MIGPKTPKRQERAMQDDGIDWRAQGLRFRDFSGYVWQRFQEDRCLRMAASLSYTSLLAIVPLTAIAFAMLAAFPVFGGVREQFQEAVFANLLPESAEAMREYFDQFITNATKLTAVGIIGLALTAILLLGTVESALNAIFRVKHPRALVPRLLVFWALITLGPLMLGASFSLSTYFFAMTKASGFDAVKGPLASLSVYLPTIIMIVLFWAFYLIIPNRPVGWRSAAVGGAVAGLMFSVLRTVFGYYVTSFPTYQTIYGAVSVVPIFLVWMYLSWAVVLFGAVLTASLAEWKTAGGRPAGRRLGTGERMALALEIIALLFEQSRAGGRISWSRVLKGTSGGGEAVENILDILEEKGWAARAADNEWVLARDVGEAKLYDLFRDLGLALRDRDVDVAGDGWRWRLSQRLAEVKRLHQGALDVSVREILIGIEPQEPARQEKSQGLRPVS